MSIEEDKFVFSKKKKRKIIDLEMNKGLNREKISNLLDITNTNKFFLDNFVGELDFGYILEYLGGPNDFPTYEESFNNEYDKAVINLRKGIIDSFEFEKIKIKFKKLEQYKIKCKNIEDFKKIVGLLPLSEERKKYYIEHELEHGIKAQEYNLNYFYGLFFTKVPKGEEGLFRITPFTSVEYPENISFEEYKKMFTDIVTNVDKLSNGDNKQIESLK